LFGGPSKVYCRYERTRKAKPWDGTPNGTPLEEFQAAWKKFLCNLDEPFKSKFEREIAEKLKPGSEFRCHNLRGI
jgi:hypothetical protein